MHLSKLSLFASLLTIISSSVIAQPDNAPISHFSLGVSGGLTLDQWHLNKTELSEGVTESSESIPGYFGNVSGSYAFGKHWQLRTSAEVHSRELEYRIDGLHFGQDFNGTGFNDSHFIYNTKATKFVVPLTIEFILGGKKVRPFFTLGLAGEFLLNETTEGIIYFSDGTTQQTASEDISKKSNFAALAGSGIYYHASNKISLSIAAMFSYSFPEYSFNRHQYSVGLSTGIFYTL